MSRFTTVPPAIVPSNSPDRTDADIKQDRSRQATFERGVALAIVASMRQQCAQLRTLKVGLRWLLDDQEAGDLSRWLSTLHEDILRTERIEERAEHG